MKFMLLKVRSYCFPLTPDTLLTSPVKASAQADQLGAVSSRATWGRLWGMIEKCFGVWTAWKRKLVLPGICFSYKSLSWLGFAF